MEKIKKRVIELEILPEMEDSGVEKISLVEDPAIESNFMFFRKEKFVEPGKGEGQSDFMSRCVPAMMDEGKEQDQAVAMCISMYGEKMGYDVSSLPAYVEQVPKKKTKMAEEKFLDPNPCWEGYEAYGLKDDGTPNCIPIKGKKLRQELKKQAEYAFATEEDGDKKVLVGPAMIPDMEILRREEDGSPYYVKFSKETIAEIQQKFMMEMRNHETNLDHQDNSASSYVFESWIVEGDPKLDKANSVYKLGVPAGTWCVKMKVTDPKVWADVKAGKYKGFSIEGNFIDKAELDQIEKEKELVEEIMRILQS